MESAFYLLNSEYVTDIFVSSHHDRQQLQLDGVVRSVFVVHIQIADVAWSDCADDLILWGYDTDTRCVGLHWEDQQKILVKRQYLINIDTGNSVHFFSSIKFIFSAFFVVDIPI